MKSKCNSLNIDRLTWKIVIPKALFFDLGIFFLQKIGFLDYYLKHKTVYSRSNNDPFEGKRTNEHYRRNDKRERNKKLCENFCSKIQLNLYTLNYAL